LDESYVSQVLSLIQERAKTLAEVPQLADFFFLDELGYDTGLLLKGKLDAKSATRGITIASQKLEQTPTWDAATLEGILRSLATELNLRPGELFGLLRVAITGRTAAPPLFQTMAVLGKQKCLKRFRMTLQLLPACLD
jgi:glutamyl-tRNA synthetase